MNLPAQEIGQHLAIAFVWDVRELRIAELLKKFAC